MIVKKGNVWWLDIWVGHGKTRKRVRRSLKTNDRALALEHARDVERDLEQGRQGVALKDFVSQYLIRIKQGDDSLPKNEDYILDVLVARFARENVTRLDQVTPAFIERILISLMAERDVGKVTANMYLVYLKKMFTRAVDWGVYTGPSPADKVHPFKTKKDIWVPTDKEKEQIIAAAVEISTDPQSVGRSLNHRIAGDYVTFLFNTGMRRAEALLLEKENIRDKSAFVLGKGNRWRAVPLNDAAWKIVNRQVCPSKYVFNCPNRFADSPFDFVVQRIRKATKIERFSLHSCRKWATVAMLRRGVDIKTVMDILGHTKIDTTLLIYAYSYEESRRDAVDRLGHVFETPPTKLLNSDGEPST
jgi:integrase